MWRSLQLQSYVSGKYVLIALTQNCGLNMIEYAVYTPRLSRNYDMEKQFLIEKRYKRLDKSKKEK